MSDDAEQLQEKVEALEREVAALKSGMVRRGQEPRQPNTPQHHDPGQSGIGPGRK